MLVTDLSLSEALQQWEKESKWSGLWEGLLGMQKCMCVSQYVYMHKI